MEILLPKFPTPLFGLTQNSPTLTKQSLPTPFLSAKPPSLRNAKLCRRNYHAVAKDESSLSSIITELETERQTDEEKTEEFNRHQPEDQLASRWREILGCDYWAGLLDPLDPLLRLELIRYGEMAQACYDSFDYDPCSRYCGSSKYIRRQFFDSLGMSDAGYEVSRYLYATSNIKLPNFSKKSQWSKKWSERADWIGYVAVSTDEASKKLGRRDIVIGWRGTVTQLEWVADMMVFLRPVSSAGIPCPDPSVQVEAGFVDLYTDKDSSCRFCRYSAREQVLTEVRKLVKQYTKAGEEVSITVTGHSLGSALAMLSAYDIAETGLNVGDNGEKVPVCVISFAGPRLGNSKFKERFEGLGVKALRVVNVHDTVPNVPGALLNERMPEFLWRLVEWLPWTYSHVGVEFALDHKKSPFLKDTSDPSCFHNLEAYIHLLDGYSAREQVLTEVRKLVKQYTKAGEEVSITVTGHSLGSALAMLSAYDIAETGLNVGDNGEEVPVCVISFSGPRVGNNKFKERFEGLGVKALRVVNVHDTVPNVPGILFNERMPDFVRRFAEGLPWAYCHVGVEFALDHKKSPFLKETSDPSCFHNLEAHLHLLDGYHGRGERFVLAGGRDPALVNKSCDFLKNHHMVPPHWRQDENKGMIRAGDGRWIQPDRSPIDDHPADTHHHLQQLGLRPEPESESESEPEQNQSV